MFSEKKKKKKYLPMKNIKRLKRYNIFGISVNILLLLISYF